jgi:hypothetical protein
METRRIRRRARQRSRRVVSSAVALSAVGVAVGLALPRNPVAAGVLLVLAVAALAGIALRTESIAPSHGLHHVVRLPPGDALTATFASGWARCAGTARAVLHLPHRATVVPPDHHELDDHELDEEAAAWWGPTRAPASRPVSVTLPAELDDVPPGPGRLERVRAGLARRWVGTRGHFTRRMGASHVAGDSPSGDVVEGGTVSAGAP